MVPGSEEGAAVAASLCSLRLLPNRDSSMLAQPDNPAAAAIAQRTAHRRAAIRDVICRLCAPAVAPGVACFPAAGGNFAAASTGAVLTSTRRPNKGARRRIQWKFAAWRRDLAGEEGVASRE